MLKISKIRSKSILSPIKAQKFSQSAVKDISDKWQQGIGSDILTHWPPGDADVMLN